MRIPSIHDWPSLPSDAVILQNELRHKVQIEPYRGLWRRIAGADVSFNKYSSTVYAAIVVLEMETFETIDLAEAVMEVQFPYIPGLLSFREIPPLLKAWEKLQVRPDIMMLDGQGVAHPRRLGIASHMGVVLDIPTIGCAKGVLVGKYQEPAIEKGRWSPMFYHNEEIGAALRTKNKVKPVFVSPGHRMDIPSAIDITLQCARGYRIPEPTRQAHLRVNDLRRRLMRPVADSSAEGRIPAN